MQPFVLKYHPWGSPPPSSGFFVLSRGNHTGRPDRAPFRNSFVLTCSSKDLDTYYWLVYALWSGRAFEPYLIGSVIAFIHIRDLRRLIAEARINDRLIPVIANLQKVACLEDNLQRQIALARQLRRSLAQSLYRQTRPSDTSGKLEVYPVPDSCTPLFTQNHNI